MIEIRHEKEVDHEVVDTLNSEQNGGGSKGKNSPPKNNKNTWIAVAVLIALVIFLIVSNGR